MAANDAAGSYVARHTGGSPESVGQPWVDYNLWPVSAGLGLGDVELRKVDGVWVCSSPVDREAGLPCEHLCALFGGNIQAADIHPRFFTIAQDGKFDDELRAAPPWRGCSGDRDPPQHSGIVSLPRLCAAAVAAAAAAARDYAPPPPPEGDGEDGFLTVQAATSESVRSRPRNADAVRERTFQSTVQEGYAACGAFPGAADILIERLKDAIEEVYASASCRTLGAAAASGSAGGVVDHEATAKSGRRTKGLAEKSAKGKKRGHNR